MKPRLIEFKPGVITLFDKETDSEFSGSLLLKTPNEPIIESKDGEEEINKEMFLKEVDTHLAKISNGPSEVDYNPFIEEVEEPISRNILKEYLDLIDFPLLFGFLWDKLKLIFEKLFYSENVSGPKAKDSLKKFGFLANLSLPNINFGILSKISFSISLVSFILLLVYFSSSHLSLGANTNSPNPVRPVENQIGFQKPVKQFEPTPDPEPISREFQIKIDKINLTSDVTPNVDLADEAVYKQKLHEDGIAHALGSYFPGQDGPVYLFAHSTDTLANIPLFNAKFYSLKDLGPGDTVDISYHGKIYNYTISDKQIIRPDEINIIQNTTSKLVLQTCWPPGTDWQRLVIFADPI